jgi:hypothetical protein
MRLAPARRRRIEAVGVVLRGTPSAGLQALADAAAPGATLAVPPGSRAGPIDPGGRAITLRSTNGPTETFVRPPQR